MLFCYSSLGTSWPSYSLYSCSLSLPAVAQQTPVLPGWSVLAPILLCCPCPVVPERESETAGVGPRMNPPGRNHNAIMNEDDAMRRMIRMADPAMFELGLEAGSATLHLNG